MTFDDMKEYLNKIQNDSAQTKTLNAILACYQQVKILEQLVIDLQKKVNEIINEWNEQVTAEALNSDIEEDTPEWDAINEATVPADSQTVEEVK